jgi:hypothetical protein
MPLGQPKQVLLNSAHREGKKRKEAQLFIKILELSTKNAGDLEKGDILGQIAFITSLFKVAA